MVRVSRGHINAPHGLSHTERDHLAQAIDHLRQRGPCLFVSIEAGRSSTSESTVRKITRRLRSDLAQRQRRAGMRRRFAVSVFEARGRDGLPKFGAHVIGVLPSVADRDRAIESFNRSAYAQIGPDARPSVFAEPVTDWAGLTRYLLKEATPQAWYGAGKSFRRVGGSIPLGILGGDRVTLSEDLRDALILGGRIAPYRRAYARRRPKAPAIIYRDELFSPLPVLAAPVRPKPAPRKRERHELPTLPLSCPPTIADMLAGLGPTHETIAQQVGLSRAQVTNVIVGRFGVSRPIAQRVLKLARAA